MLTVAQQNRQQAFKKKSSQYWKQIAECGMLECRVCHILLPLKENFTPCLKILEKSGYLSYNKECKKCRGVRHFNDRNFVKISLEDVLKDRLYAATIRASNKNLPIDINLDFLLKCWIKQNGLCFYTKKPLSLEINNQDKVSIDRLDSSKGYLQDNIVLCRNVINYIKNDLSIDSFKELVKDIYSNFVL